MPHLFRMSGRESFHRFNRSSNSTGFVAACRLDSPAFFCAASCRQEITTASDTGGGSFFRKMFTVHSTHHQIEED